MRRNVKGLYFSPIAKAFMQALKKPIIRNVKINPLLWQALLSADPESF